MKAIHKRADSLLLRCAAALVFLAACAWCGAGLYSRLLPRAVEATESAAALRLSGICLRREETLLLPRDAVLLPEDGARIAKNAVLARLPDGGELCAKESAVYLCGADGLEALRVETLDELSPARLRALAETASPLPAGVCGRLVYDAVWYYAAVAPDWGDADAPRACRLRFAGFSEWLPARLVQLGAEENGERALLFRLSRGGDYLKLRRVEAELIFP